MFEIILHGLGALTGDPEEAISIHWSTQLLDQLQQAIGFVAGETLNSIEKDYVSYMRGLSDDSLDQQIDALEAAGALRVVKS